MTFRKRAVFGFPRRTLSVVFISLVLVIISFDSHAQTFTYDFPGNPGSGAAASQTNAQPSGGTYSDFTRVNVTGNSTVGAFGSTAWNTGTSIDLTEYVTYSLTPTAGNFAFLQQQSFSVVRSATGPANGEVRLFGDTTAAALASQAFSPPTAAATTTFNFTDVIAGETLTFRMYGWNASSAAGSMTFDNVTTTGATANFQASSANITLSSATIIYANAAALSLSGDISGSGSVQKLGTNTVTLSGTNNTYSGGTSITAGTLQLSGSATLGSTTASLTVNGGTLDVFGTAQTVGNLTGTGGTITNTPNGQNTILTIGNGNATGGNYQGVITQGSAILGLTKVGTGTMTLSGSTANTYTGTTLINDGELDLAKSANTKAISSSVAVGNNVGSAGSATLRLFNSNQIQGGSTVTINNDGVFDMQGFNETLSTLQLLGGSVSGTGTLTASSYDVRSGSISANLAGNFFATGVTKTTAGAVTLSGANTYTGTTDVTAGTLLVSNSAGSGTGSGNVTVNGSGTVLGGTGTISGTVTLGNTTPGATLNPGPSGTNATAASVGTLTTGALTLTGANTVHIDAFGTATNQWDKLVSTGGIMLDPSSILDVTIASGLNFSQGTTYVLLTSTGLSGTFSGIVDGQTYNFSGYDFTADYTGTGFDLVAIPEPSTWAGAALAAAVIGCQFRVIRRKRRVVTT